MRLQKLTTRKKTNSNIKRGGNFSAPAIYTGVHRVQFYEDDAYLIKSLQKYLEEGKIGIVVVTPEHKERLEKTLRIGGLCAKDATEAGTYVALDAQDTLLLFMRDGMPDRKLFFENVGGVIEKATKVSAKVYAFGEMVALLWHQGNKEGALSLESLWNELRQKYTFELFCAYPLNTFADGSHEELLRVCDSHTNVVPTEEYTTLVSTEDKLKEIILLQQKARTLEREIERSKILERQKDNFLAVASHELKTPVTSIKAYGQALHKEFLRRGDANAAALLSKMDQQINKLTSLIEDLLDVSKIQTGQIVFNDRMFDANELLLEVVGEMQMLAPRHTLEVELSDSVTVYADRERISQVITNLLTNAIKYSPMASHIRITSESTPQALTVRVQDFGVGIRQENHEKIFERFYRVHDGLLETFPGLGLGLHISSEIIKRENGSIWVESIEGQGSVFSFSLPVASGSKTK